MNALKIVAFALLGLLAVLLLGGLLTRPSRLPPATSIVELNDAVENHLSASEKRVHEQYGIVPGAGKRVVWARGPGEKTEFAVIYLHGFSATRQEVAPLPELLAQTLGANLFETRLAGHGLQRARLQNVAAEAWLRDGAEALAVGRALGERLILVGTSTGATVALAMAQHPHFASVDSLVLLSPNFGPAASGAEIATGFWGPQIMRLVAGEFREWEAANEQQEVYWTTRYPTRSLVEMMRLVDLAVKLAPHARVRRAMLVYSPKDDVVSVDKLLAGFESLPAADKEILRIDEPQSISPHVLTGDILAPGTAEGMAEEIAGFLQRQ